MVDGVETGSSKNADEAQANGDAAWGRGDWHAAARAYLECFEHDPTRTVMLVQYGHAQKMMGDFAAAEGAYKRALEINDKIADFHHQHALALKLLGRLAEAEQAFRQAHELDPKWRDPIRELAVINPEFTPLNIRREACIALDLSDLFFYLRHHPTPSGIQRVQLGATEALSNLQGDVQDEIRYVVDAGHEEGYIVIQASGMGRLRLELARPKVSHERLLRIMDEEIGQGDRFVPRSGDTVVVLGAFWVIDTAVQRYIGLKRAGVRVVVLIHDIIPLTHPEFCEASLTNVFRSFCSHVLQIADIILTVSDHTGRQVAAYMSKMGFDVGDKIKTLRSAQSSLSSPSRGGSAPPSSALARVLESPFVVYVSTIEIRKNHTLLFRIWKELIAKHGAERVPLLVFVGRPGWRVRDLMDQLDSTNMLDGSIVILNGLSDTEINLLYSRALFSAFPSFEEGWGLPVGEGLTQGRPCVASNTSSVPEVGGDFAVYTDPFNLNESLSVFESMIFDDARRESLAQRIKEEFRPRNWLDVARDLLDLLAAAKSAKPQDHLVGKAPAIDPGRLWSVGHADDFDDFITEGLGSFIYFLFDDGWGSIENFGRWLIRRSGSIEFAVADAATTRAEVLLAVETPGWQGERTKLALYANGVRFAPAKLASGRRTWLFLKCPVVDGVIKLEFNVEGEISQSESDPRLLAFGLHAFGYAGDQDFNARLGLLQDLMLNGSLLRSLRLEGAGRARPGSELVGGTLLASQGDGRKAAE